MPQLDHLLLEFYAPDGPERVGFVLRDGSIVEVENDAPSPDTGFDVAPEDLITFGERAVASWHTHPGASANLSILDNSAFLSWPLLHHHVIGMDGIKTYFIEGQRVCQT